MNEEQLIERIETQAAELAELRAKLENAVKTAENLAELEGRENELQDQNEALRRAIAEQNEIIENMTAPIQDVAIRLEEITKAAGTVDTSAIQRVNDNINELNTTAEATKTRLQSIPSAVAAHWIVTAACVIVAVAALLYSANCARNAERAAQAAAETAKAVYWGIYTTPDDKGRSHSVLEWSADWQAWSNGK